MKTPIRRAAVAAVLVLGAGAASAGISVNYINPERYADIGSGEWERELVLRDLTKHFDKLAKNLPAGHELTLNITEIDLSGQEYSGKRATGDLRVRQGRSDWPYIEIHYTLTANGQTVDSGVAQLSDPRYMIRPIRSAYETDNLRFEKRMLDEWFKNTILKK
jgi:hypothetical protein